MSGVLIPREIGNQELGVADVVAERAHGTAELVVATRESELISTPGVIGQIQLAQQMGFSLSDPRVARIVSQRALVEFLGATGIRVDGGAGVATANYLDVIRSGFLDRLLLLLANLKQKSVYPAQQISMPLAEVHCPHLAGCKAAIKYEKTVKKGLSLKWTFTRIGVGGGYKKEITLAESVFTEAECVQIVKVATIAIYEYVTFDEQNSLYYPRILKWQDGVHVTRIDEEDHVCGADFDEREGHVCDPSLEAYRLSPTVVVIETPAARVERSMKIETGRMLEATLDFAIPVAGTDTEIACSITSDVVRSAECSYELVGPGKYLRYSLGPDRANPCWAWTLLRQPLIVGGSSRIN